MLGLICDYSWFKVTEWFVRSQKSERLAPPLRKESLVTVLLRERLEPERELRGQGMTKIAGVRVRVLKAILHLQLCMRGETVT